MKIILASQSARRRELLSQAGLTFTVVAADIDETQHAGEDALSLVSRLAVEKAQTVGQRHPGDIVIAADTVVCLAGEVIGKPKDMEDAKATLRRLSGNAHQVHTGIALWHAATESLEQWHATSDVQFCQLDDDTIARYVTLSNPLDKAGAYAIQEHGDMVVESYKGRRSTIVGLPIEEVVDRLERFRGKVISRDNAAE